MPIAHSPTIVFCVIAYLALCFGIGIWAMRRTHSSSDFFLAGKSLGPMVVVLATMSSIMSEHHNHRFTRRFGRLS